MFQLFFTPEWFNGWDLLFDTISLVVALFIAGYSWYFYRLNKENKFGYFSLAFLLVSLAFIFKIVTQGLVYFVPLRDAATVVLAPVVGKGHTGIHYSELFFRGGYFLSMVTMLGAWLLLFFVSQKKHGRLRKFYEISQIGLFVYLVVLISIVSNFNYFVFYLTSAVILGITVLNYYKNYLDTNKNKNAFRVMLAFLFILSGNFFFIFVFLQKSLYVAGEIFLLIGFLLLLYTYHITSRKPRQKREDVFAVPKKNEVKQ